MKSKFLPAALAGVALAAILGVANEYAGVHLSPAVLQITRWIAVAGMLGYAIEKKSLTTWIFVAMLLGGEIGYDWPRFGTSLQVLAQIFLKLIKTIIAPLIFGTLVVGIAGHSDLKKVGRMGVKALVYFELVTTVALFIGLAAINFSKAGVGVQQPPAGAEQIAPVKQSSAKDIILHVFPENIAKSTADAEVLQIVVFSVMFGIALAMVPEGKRAPMLHFAEGLTEVMFKFTNIVMLFAPVGVAGAIAYTVGNMGLGIMVNLIKLVATLYAALTVFLTCVLLPIAKFAGVPVKRFIKAIAEPVTVAFATASSEAALPLAMEKLENMGVPRKIVAFVLPTGYSFNLDGSTLYLSLAAVFVAQAANIPLSFGQQLLIVFTLMLTSKGVAGVARASLVILLGTLASFNLPVWPVFVILGVDTLMDMARTSVNVIGNCLASVVVARWEGDFDKDAPAPAMAAAEGVLAD